MSKLVLYTKASVPTIFCHSEINIYVKYKTAVLLREPIEIFEKGAEY